MSFFGTDDGAGRWDARYGGDDYVFGVEPSRFLVANREHLPGPGGTALCIADGEGRNGTWLARQGLAVTAFDVSLRAHEKALALDRARGVDVTRRLSGLGEWRFGVAAWDVVVASMVQFAPPPLRTWMFGQIRACVRPGGVAFVHGYTPKQVEYRTGGPPQAEHMYTAAMLERAFEGWETVVLREYEEELAEGSGHVGRSALVDLVARRPAHADLRE